jgi:hypothetical protein
MNANMACHSQSGDLLFCYALFCTLLAVFLGELAFRPQRMPLRDRQSAEAIAARFDTALQDVSISARDGVQLRGW